MRVAEGEMAVGRAADWLRVGFVVQPEFRVSRVRVSRGGPGLVLGLFGASRCV